MPCRDDHVLEALPLCTRTISSSMPAWTVSALEYCLADRQVALRTTLFLGFPCFELCSSLTSVCTHLTFGEATRYTTLRTIMTCTASIVWWSTRPTTRVPRTPRPRSPRAQGIREICVLRLRGLDSVVLLFLPILIINVNVNVNGTSTPLVHYLKVAGSTFSSS